MVLVGIESGGALFFIHPFIQGMIASTLAEIVGTWPAASMLWLIGFAYAVKNLWATR